MPGVGLEQEKQTAQGAMEISVSRQELLRELTATQSVVERKTTIPILSNFLLEADNDRLTITGTDLDQSMKTSCAAKVKKPGSCTIPARKLYDYIKLLGDGDISIKLLENHWVQIRAGRSNTKMVGMARANFPQVPEFPETSLTRIPTSSLKNLISKTIFAISNEESRYTLNGALLVLKAESLTMVATDGHRLAHIEKSGETLSNISGEKRTLIPRKALQELQSLLSVSEDEYLEFADDEQTLFFRIGHRTLTSRKLTGQFPNYEAVMPRDNNKFVVVRSEDLTSSIQRVAQFADERSGAIKIRLEQNELRISSSSTDAGESEDVIETPYHFDPLVVGFNSSYLLDFLKAVGNTGEVRLEFKDAQSAGQMRPEDGSDEYKYRYIIMPMRI
ncbi:DNA polymerase III subunit beta [Pseudacidobacterium ailaaui]|jgi:DNA polymerase-3 subunit beta|uniref:DNA polymerase III subunit beta n=1 Tax=Pseudacidobacterium ailaaui TaxID=1382359 RepID=UPI0006787A61|nr:DNA polymerase III subunit beta [Pseudacidobacterium ailaaui]MDI3253417.1 DNA polymerase III subunit beta [Bacillota bacterium]